VPSWIYFILLLTLMSCSQEQGPDLIPPLINRYRDMSIHRTDLGHTATVKFFTVYPAYCKVEYWHTDYGDNPPMNVRKRKACFRKSPTQSHFVRLENLVRGKPLYIRLLVSSSDPTLASFSDLLVLKETSASYTYFPPDNYSKDDDKNLKVTVIKANLTQASASVYSNRVNQEELDQQKTFFTSVLKEDNQDNCESFRIPHPGFLLPPRTIGLSKVYTTGYYSTSGLRIDKKLGIFLLDYTGKLEPAKSWVFKFDLTEDPSALKGAPVTSVEHDFSAPPEFRSAKMTAPKDRALNKHNLMKMAEPITVKHTEGLEFSWEARNTQENDYFEILIGKPSQGNALKCRYSIRTKILSLSPKDLEPLVGRRYDVIVSLNRKEISHSTNGHTVFLHTHDWRHLALKFL